MTTDERNDGILDPRRYLPGDPVGKEFFGRSILATFPDPDGARTAAAELRDAGYRDVQVDEVSFRPAESGTLRDQPWPVSLTNVPDHDKRSLVSQDPSVGGGSMGGEELVGGHHYLLTVVVEDGRFDRPLEIIRKNGGNPDTGGPR